MHYLKKKKIINKYIFNHFALENYFSSIRYASIDVLSMKNIFNSFAYNSLQFNQKSLRKKYTDHAASKNFILFVMLVNDRPLIKLIKHLTVFASFSNTLYNTCSFYLEIADSEIDEGRGNEGWRETRGRHGQFWWVRVFVGKGIRRGLRNDLARATAIGWFTGTIAIVPMNHSFGRGSIPCQTKIES